MTNVLPGAEDGYFGPIVHELHRIANDLTQIASFELPEPRHFELNIQPGGESDQEIIEAINAIGLALLGKAGQQSEVDGKPWYNVVGYRGPVKIHVYRWLATPDPRDAEIARLRAEVEKLRAGSIAEHYDTTDPDADEESCACGEAFRSRELLQRHIAVRNGSGPRPEDAAECTEPGCTDHWIGDPCPAPADGPVQIVPHGPVRPPYGSPERAAFDRRTCVDPGDQEHDHETCRDVVAEEQDDKPECTCAMTEASFMNCLVHGTEAEGDY